MKCPYCIKICTKCNRLLVAYSGNFHKNKNYKYKVTSQCKKCIAEYKQQYYKENKEEIAKQQKEYYEEHKEEKLEYQKEYYEEHKEEVNEYKQQYYKEHKEEYREYAIQYRENNKEKIAKYKHQYYEENKEEIAEKGKQYRSKNPHINFNHNIKRRQKEESQGRGLTKEQWYEMMFFFDWCCAYSDEYIGGNSSKHRTIDHIIALDNGGLNEPWNCVPCFDNYNYQKHTNNMEDWYIQQEFYSEERLIKIYAWCEYAFNKWKPRRKGNKKINEQAKNK